MKIESKEVHIHYPDPSCEILRRLDCLERKIDMNQQELTQALSDLKTQADKAKAEIVAEVANLEDAINNAKNVDPAVVDAFNSLKDSVQGLDDLNADAAPAPAPTPPDDGTGTPTTP